MPSKQTNCFLMIILREMSINQKILFPLKCFSLICITLKVLNKVSYIPVEQRCSGLQQRKCLTQRSNAANTRSTTCFFLYTNYIYK